MSIQGNLDLLYRNDPAVFVAGDHLIYPVEGDATIRKAPDVYVAFGRPKGHRGSYQVWEEGGVFPQVVFEVLSPGNTAHDMIERRKFYDRYGAEEFYVYDPQEPDPEVEGWVRAGGKLRAVSDMDGFVSPRLGVRFDLSGAELVLYGPAGDRFLTFVELGEVQRQAVAEAAVERQRAEQERRRAEQEQQRAAVADERAARLAARLRELGVDPDAV